MLSPWCSGQGWQQDWCGREGRGAGVRVAVQPGRQEEEPGSLLPRMSLPSLLGLSPAAEILPVAAVVAVLRARKF